MIELLELIKEIDKLNRKGSDYGVTVTIYGDLSTKIEWSEDELMDEWCPNVEVTIVELKRIKEEIIMRVLE